jgi:signal transduction histidine kinase
VLGAVAEGGRGIYEGTTYEGFVNKTAYATSEETGWSTHVAIDSDVFDGPRQRASLIIVAGSLVAIVAGLMLFLVAVRDAASRRQQELKMLELQRAETVSQFTATIVHDFRNVVSALQAGMRMIKKQTRNDEIKRHVEMIEQSIERGTRLANQLLSFSRGEESTIESIDLSGIFSDLRFLIEHAVGPEVTFSVEMPPEPLSVRANRDQLELAILNLAMNARDAMKGSGRLLIQARACGNTVELRVSDDGPGVAADQREAIFAPFVTTKALGTGLGLAQVAGMAANAGGRVYVEDSEIGGACFAVVLPNASPVAGDLERSGPAARLDQARS